MYIHNSIHSFLYFFIHIIFHSKIVSLNSSLLNHITRLGDENYRYNRFLFDMEGNMIIDTTAFPLEKVRNFYGITKEGKEYFTVSGEKNYHRAIIGNTDKGRIEGVSSFIRITSNKNNYKGKERVLSISKAGGDKYLTEIADLEKGEITVMFNFF